MNKLEMLVVTASFVFLPGLSCAANWNCAPDVEVQCTVESCEVMEDQGTIPIGLSFDTRGVFSLCAYSGCWEGKGKVVSVSPFLVITLGNVDWSDPNQRVEGREDVLIAFGAKDQVAMVKAGSISMPMRCSKMPRLKDGT
jgi:hypothetical protein